MASNSTVSRAVRLALVAAAAYGSAAAAQEVEMEQIVVTGTRITLPGTVSASPITTVGAEEIRLQQQSEIERVLRTLPIVLPADGQNVNNGTVGVASINLRGLGAQRNLILLNGKRITPYNINGIVDTSVIPTALIERTDIITGGASAVYGSDAISGAINFVTRQNFEGVELTTDYSITEEGDGDTKSISAVLGSNVADGRGNVTLGLTWSERDGVRLGDRPLGQLGIDTASGAGYEQFLRGDGPTPAPFGCGGPGSVVSGGSTTTLPTRVQIFGVPAGNFAGQFRDDGTLGTNCSVFNFNPFNYYQTPLERFGGIALGNFEVNDHAEAYGRFLFSSTEVRQQVAPSGFFGNSFWTPMSNPLIGAQARGAILAGANANLGLLNDPAVGDNWRDLNNNGVVDAADELNIQYRRRTVEFGERSTTYSNDAFQLMGGVRGDLVADWDYDLSYQFGSSSRTNLSAGYTNVANAEQAVRSLDGVTCLNGDPTCVPINLWGGFGSITSEMARYSGAVAIEKQDYEQMIISAVATGTVGQLPWVGKDIGVSFGYEYREESGETSPDECWKLAPTSCLGGAGGNLLPIKGGYHVNEGFIEAIVPVLADLPMVQSFDLDLGYRYSDYNLTGAEDTWKAGFRWKPISTLMVRATQQRAIRAPNVGELAAPVTASLFNAQTDPCSITNQATITPEIAARCIATGMTPGAVGAVEDLVSGQVNAFSGTNQAALPKPETADTLTVGFVWTPGYSNDWYKGATLSVDYYDIEIEDVIGEFAPQEVLDGCYLFGVDEQCAKINRVGGTLTNPGSGLSLLTQNLKYLQAEGVEVGAMFSFALGNWGDLAVSANYNRYLTQESQSDNVTPVLDCLGFYGSSCGNPLPEDRWIQRTTWSFQDFDVSYLWRHVGSAKIEEAQRDGTFEAFRSIDSADYLDLYVSYTMFDNWRLSLGVTNVTDEDPPVVGNEAGTTDANSGNTFPSVYDPLGRVFTVGLNVKF